MVSSNDVLGSISVGDSSDKDEDNQVLLGVGQGQLDIVVSHGDLAGWLVEGHGSLKRGRSEGNVGFVVLGREGKGVIASGHPPQSRDEVHNLLLGLEALALSVLQESGKLTLEELTQLLQVEVTLQLLVVFVQLVNSCSEESLINVVESDSIRSEVVVLDIVLELGTSGSTFQDDILGVSLESSETEVSNGVQLPVVVLGLHILSEELDGGLGSH